MVFEILNIIRFAIFIVVSAIAYYYLSKKFDILKWKYFFTGVFIIAGITHAQFYTLTEKSDVNSTVNIMLQQKHTKSNRNLKEYLHDSEMLKKEELSLEEEIEKQKQLSKKLIEEMKEENRK